MITNDPQNYCFVSAHNYNDVMSLFKKEELFLKRRSSGEFRQHLQDSSNHFSAQALLSNETHINMDEQDGAALIIEITEFLPDFILRSCFSFFITLHLSNESVLNWIGLPWLTPNILRGSYLKYILYSAVDSSSTDPKFTPHTHELPKAEQTRRS
nr:unnamed protein product [Fasciola hepatica]